MAGAYAVIADAVLILFAADSALACAGRQSITNDPSNRATAAMMATMVIYVGCAGMASRPDAAASHASGYFDICIEALAAFAARGTSGLVETSHCVVYFALGALRFCRVHPGAEVKIRGIAPALAFCLEPASSLDYIEAIGMTSGGAAAQVCEYSHRPLYCRGPPS